MFKGVMMLAYAADDIDEVTISINLYQAAMLLPEQDKLIRYRFERLPKTGPVAVARALRIFWALVWAFQQRRPNDLTVTKFGLSQVFPNFSIYCKGDRRPGWQDYEHVQNGIDALRDGFIDFLDETDPILIFEKLTYVEKEFYVTATFNECLDVHIIPYMLSGSFTFDDYEETPRAKRLAKVKDYTVKYLR
jgi:hypothetical protein